MGNEGQASPRDVASEEKKHPWEVFPDGETSAESGGKKREKKEKKKFNLGKNKRFLIIGAVLLVLIGVGAFFGIKFLTENKSEDEKPQAEVLSSSLDVTTVEDAATVDLAYGIAYRALDSAANEGAYVGDGYDIGIIRDNIDAFLKKQTEESDRLYYQMIAVSLLSVRNETEEAEYYLEDVNGVSYDDLTNKQKYAYILCHLVYYNSKEDEEKVKEYRDMLEKEFPLDEEEYVESGTNNIVESPKWEEN